MRYEVVTNKENYVIVIHHTGNSKRDVVELDLSDYDFTNHRLHAYKLAVDSLVFDENRYQEILKEIDDSSKQKEIDQLQFKLDNSDYIVARAFEEVMSLTNPLTWVADVIKIMVKYSTKYKETIKNRKAWRERIEELRDGKH